MRRESVSGDDLRRAGRNSFAVLMPLADRDWSVGAWNMTWTCRKTLDHMLNCLAWYAHDFAGEIKSSVGAARDEMPGATIEDLIITIPNLADVLALVGEGKQFGARGWHDWGIADAEGFLAMGAIEISTHTWDIVMALDPDNAAAAIMPEVAARLLPRLFPEAPTGFGPVETLLWVTGRGELPGLQRVTQWQWHSAPVD